jgi:hypothetical protein
MNDDVEYNIKMFFCTLTRNAKCETNPKFKCDIAPKNHKIRKIDELQT